jgi:hypothetical protein
VVRARGYSACVRAVLVNFVFQLLVKNALVQCALSVWVPRLAWAAALVPPCFYVATRACCLCSCVIACWLDVLVARACAFASCVCGLCQAVLSIVCSKCVFVHAVQSRAGLAVPVAWAC